MTHVRTSPFYPQSNGKQERWHATLKRYCIRPGTPLSLEDARRIVARFVAHYNDVRLHSAVGYIAPKDKLEGRAETNLAERERKLAAAREARKTKRQALSCAKAGQRNLTARKEVDRLPLAGETEAGPAGEQPARDSRPGGDEYPSGEARSSSPKLVRCASRGPGDKRSPATLSSGYSEPSPMPQKTPGSGAEPQAQDVRERQASRDLLNRPSHLSNSR